MVDPSSTLLIRLSKCWRFLGTLTGEELSAYLENQKCWAEYRRRSKVTYYKCTLSQKCTAVLRTVGGQARSFIALYDNRKQHSHPDEQSSSGGPGTDSTGWKLVHAFSNVVLASMFLDSQRHWLSSSVTGSQHEIKFYNCAIAAGCPVMFKLVFDYEHNLAILYSNQRRHSSSCESFGLQGVADASALNGSVRTSSISEFRGDGNKCHYSGSLRDDSMGPMEDIVSPTKCALMPTYASLTCDQTSQIEESQHDNQEVGTTMASDEESPGRTRGISSSWKAAGAFTSWNDAFNKASQNGPWKRGTGKKRRGSGIVYYLCCPNKSKNECPARAAILKPHGQETYLYFRGKNHLRECNIGYRRKKEALTLVLRKWHSGSSLRTTHLFLQKRGFSEMNYGKVRYLIEVHSQKEPSCPECNALRRVKKPRGERANADENLTCSACDSNCTEKSSELELCRGRESASVEIFSPASTPSVNMGHHATLQSGAFQSSVMSLNELNPSTVFESYKAFQSTPMVKVEVEESLIVSRKEDMELSSTEAVNDETMTGTLVETSLSQGTSRLSSTATRSKRTLSVGSSTDYSSVSNVNVREEGPEFALRLLHGVTRQNVWMKRELDDLRAADRLSDTLDDKSR